MDFNSLSRAPLLLPPTCAFNTKTVNSHSHTTAFLLSETYTQACHCVLMKGIKLQQLVCGNEGRGLL